MSTSIIGAQSPTTNDKNPQVSGSASQQASNETQVLTPDAPPRPVDTGAKPRRPRGFAAMDRTLVSEIARKGGKAAHSAGTAHEFTSEEAREAGRKGGRATHAKRRQAGESQDDKPSE